MSIRGLGYIGLAVSDLAAWRRFLARVFAMELTERPDGAVDARIDRWHRRFTLRAADADGLACIGWEVTDRAALETLVARVREASGVRGANGGSARAAVREFTAGESRERGVLGGASFVDPIFGVTHEVFHGPTIVKAQYAPARAFGAYETGDLGLGHIVLMTPHQDHAIAYFRDVLGFRESDSMSFGGERWGGDYRMVFMHCNSRHHSLAIMSPPAPGPGTPLNHIALTVRDADDIGYAYDIVIEDQVPVLMTPGRHINDLSTSFYVATPSGFAMEMAHGGVSIGENWKTSHYTDTKIWGHHLILPPAPVRY